MLLTHPPKGTPYKTHWAFQVPHIGSCYIQCGGFEPIIPGDRLILWSVQVEPEHRRQGIARMMVKRAVQCARWVHRIEHIPVPGLWLRCSQNNVAAAALYKSEGFRISPFNDGGTIDWWYHLLE